MEHELFNVVGASVRGSEHTRLGRNNQDAFVHWVGSGVALGVVCDGCGSAPASEVGAQLCARIVGDLLRVQLQEGQDPGEEAFLEHLASGVCARLHQFLGCLGQAGGEQIHELLLTTILGFVATPTTCRVFAAGDGIVAVNGEVQVLGPFPGNAPPYLAYALSGQNVGFQSLCCRPTAEISSLLLASDGADAFISTPDARLPGTQRRLGSLPNLSEDPRFVSHPDALRRHLFCAARERMRFDPGERAMRREAALLHDDTSIVLAQRVEAKNGT